MSNTEIAYTTAETVRFSWMGSTSENDRTGTATFSFDEFDICLKSDCYTHAQNLHKFMQELVSFVEQRTRINQKDHVRKTLLKCISEL